MNKRSIPEQCVRRGFRVSVISRRMARDNTQSQEEMLLQSKGYTGESGSDPVELWVMGPPCGFKVERGPIEGMSDDRLSVMLPTTLVPRARDEENNFPTR